MPELRALPGVGCDVEVVGQVLEPVAVQPPVEGFEAREGRGLRLDQVDVVDGFRDSDLKAVLDLPPPDAIPDDRIRGFLDHGVVGASDHVPEQRQVVAGPVEGDDPVLLEDRPHPLAREQRVLARHLEAEPLAVGEPLDPEIEEAVEHFDVERERGHGSVQVTRRWKSNAERHRGSVQHRFPPCSGKAPDGRIPSAGAGRARG